MSLAWVRPADPTVLDGRPLLDLGCGDGQTLRTLVRGPGLAVGADRSFDALRAARRSGVWPLVCATARSLPFADGRYSAVLAGDLVHHLDDEGLRAVLAEARRVMREGARLVAWWYGSAGREAVDTPRHPRGYEEVATFVRACGMGAEPLELELTVASGPPTVGLVAIR